MKNTIIPILCFLLFSSNIMSQNAKIDSLHNAVKVTKEDTNRVNLLIALCYNYYPINPDEGINLGKQALLLAQKLNWKKGIAEANNRIGVNYSVKSENQIALDYFLKSFKIDEVIGNKEGMARDLNTIAIFYHSQSDFSKALEYYSKSLEISRASGNKPETVKVLGNIGLIYLAQADYPRALEYLLQSLKGEEELGHRNGMGTDMGNIGIIYYEQKEYSKALEYYSRSLKIAEESGDMRLMIMTFVKTGLVHFEQKNYSKALENYSKALKMAEQLGNKQLIADILLDAGAVYLEQDDYTKSLETNFKSLKLDAEIGDKVGIGKSLANIGIAYYYLANYKSNAYLTRFFNGNRSRALKAAENYIDSAIFISKETGDLKNLITCYLNLSKINSAQEDYKSGLESYKAYTIYKDSVFNMEKEKKLTQKAMQYEFEKKEVLLKSEQEIKDAVALKELQKQKLVRNGFVGGFTITLLFAGVFFSQRNKIKKGKKRSDELLLNILPAEVAEELKQSGSAQAKQFDDVTVMFTDFKNFTQISEMLSPSELVEEIHTCFKAFDQIIGKYNIEKIKTIGDSYMCAGGLPVENKTNAEDVVRAAIEIRDFMLNRKSIINPDKTKTFEIRIGIHTGPVVAGIVGIKKFAYDIWGDTVNIASRMESSGEAGKINVSGTTFALVKESFPFIHRGKIEAKNKGMIDMYFVN